MTPLDALLHAASSRGWTFHPTQLSTYRATVPSIGQITGVIGNVTLWATDGNTGLFDTIDGYTFKGHIQCFTGKIEPLIKDSTKPKTAHAPCVDDTTAPGSTNKFLRRLNAQIAQDKHRLTLTFKKP
jgi:hypothetical protein